MEFSEAKRYSKEYLEEAREKYLEMKRIDEGETNYSGQEKSYGSDSGVQGRNIQKMIESDDMDQFLKSAYAACDEIMAESSENSSIKAEAVQACIKALTAAVLCLLSQVYDVDRYKDLSRQGGFVTLTYSPVFSLGLFIIKETELTNFVRKSDEVEQKQRDFGMILSIVDWMISSGGIFRNTVYTNVKESFRWVLGKGIISRALYLNILLKFFNSSDADAMFILAVNYAISPGNIAEDTDSTAAERAGDVRGAAEREAAEKEIDDVIIQRFGALPSETQAKIVEQCTYRNILKEQLFQARGEDPCPDKVLQSVIRQHVKSMIQTMWLDAGEGEQREQRSLLKFNSIDCAYVSAVLRKAAFEAEKDTDYRDDHDVKETVSSNEIRDFWDSVEIRDNHDSGKGMEGNFNILYMNRTALAMSLKEDKIYIYSHGRKNEGEAERCPDKKYIVSFDVNDWKLENLSAVLSDNCIVDTVLTYGKNPNSSDFYYSLIYLENYRGIKCSTVSFDHRFLIERNKESIILKSEETGDLINHFYGEKILSITGFVGKNGAGKSSTVDFLRDSFSCICNDLFDEKLHVKDGAIEIERPEMSRYRLKVDENASEGTKSEETRFFVIFHFNGNFYYLTNFKLMDVEKRENETADAVKEQDTSGGSLKLVNLTQVNPYQIGYMLPLHVRDRRIVYFSQFLAPAGVDAAEHELYAEDVSVINMSEEALNSTRRELIVGERLRLNRALFMELIFYYYMENQLNHYFSEGFKAGELEVKSRFLEQITEDHTDTVKVDNLSGNMIGVVVKDPMAYIRPFSSGQYSKFALLSRLFWCLKGWMVFSDVLSKKGFDVERTFEEAHSWDAIRDELIGGYLHSSDTAVLFFDEADTYYHPDWQRGFVHDIWKMIDEYRDNPVQVVFTTNSPLMLSDLTQKDVYLMKNAEEDTSVNRAVDVPGDSERRNPSIQTFGQNIHTLLAKPFFLERTIGIFADERIEWLVGLLIEVTEILDFLDNPEVTAKKKQAFLEQLKNKQETIYKKVCQIREKAAKPDANLDKRARKLQLRMNRGHVEREYVETLLRKKFFPDAGKEDISSDCIDALLRNHIRIVGEDVLRNELFDMYNDYRARIGSPVELDKQIEQMEKELRALHEKRDLLRAKNRSRDGEQV